MATTFSFNKSLRIESRDERLSSDAGAATSREILERSGIINAATKRIKDERDPVKIKHSMAELLRTALLLLVQNRRDHNDANVFRNDVSFGLAVSDRKGTKPVDHALASQPTLSRLIAALSNEENTEACRDVIMDFTSWKVLATNGGRLHDTLVIDVDSLPVKVHGKQAGSDYNGHYRARVFHPLVALAAETGDILDVELRRGKVHTANRVVGFIKNVAKRAKGKISKRVIFRMDAGFPSGVLMHALEEEGIDFVVRVANNKVLADRAEPAVDEFRADMDKKDKEDKEKERPRETTTRVREAERYKAGSWPVECRMVHVMVAKPGELFTRSFWLATSVSADEMTPEEVLELYRQRGKAEGHIGELMSVVNPSLSSTSRPKSHYRNQKVAVADTEEEVSGDENGEEEVVEDPELLDAFARNRVRLLLSILAYQVMHVQRVLLARRTGVGWSLRRLLERVLRTAARYIVSGRRITMITSAVSVHWQMLVAGVRELPDVRILSAEVV